MLTKLNQPINMLQNDALITEISGNKIDSAVPVYNEENIKRSQANKNLPGVCEQLPHHCIQLCLLS